MVPPSTNALDVKVNVDAAVVDDEAAAPDDEAVVAPPAEGEVEVPGVMAGLSLPPVLQPAKATSVLTQTARARRRRPWDMIRTVRPLAGQPPPITLNTRETATSPRMVRL